MTDKLKVHSTEDGHLVVAVLEKITSEMPEALQLLSSVKDDKWAIIDLSTGLGIPNLEDLKAQAKALEIFRGSKFLMVTDSPYMKLASKGVNQIYGVEFIVFQTLSEALEFASANPR